ncbi:MAG TPA: adenylate/guanylate cyclase domain-containing protein [Hyphomicrobiaceae bacterium]|nr:adenylate/guanylate cyclase domain-containing protein [Hyphomicrobiaceae bacterium]
MQYAAAETAIIDQLRATERALAASQALLARMLPGSVIERLTAEPGAPIADSFAEASVLFADISGFVGIARRLGNEGTVVLLNRLTRAFDALAARHGVEKIKTIGDGYMAVAGVPVPTADHCERLARLALDMREAAMRIGRWAGITIRLRIGIASGPVTAGIIGLDRIAYDVWGEAVNLASRLEQLAAADQILLSREAKEQLKAAFLISCRGEVAIKGLGTGEAWVLEGAAAEAGSGYLH